MFKIVQNLDFDVLSEVQKLRRTVKPVGVWADRPVPETGPIFGLVREPKMGTVRAPGTRRVKEAYFFQRGKRISTAKSQRWAG